MDLGGGRPVPETRPDAGICGQIAFEVGQVTVSDRSPGHGLTEGKKCLDFCAAGQTLADDEGNAAFACIQNEIIVDGTMSVFN